MSKVLRRKMVDELAEKLKGQNNLVLVDANPIDNLSVLRKPRGVMVRGRWLDRAELDAMLERMSR